MMVSLPGLDQALLTQVVREALGTPTAEVERWQAGPAGASFGSATAGVYRVAGTAHDRGAPLEWSVILKIIRPGANPENPAVLDQSHPIYWKREVLAYTSGLLDDLPGGIAAPRCFAHEEHADGSCWLWLEEAHDPYGATWPLEQYARAARCLGRFNGAYLAGRSIPDLPWLGPPGALRGLLDAFAFIYETIRDPATWQHPLLRSGFPPAIVERLVRHWQGRATLLDALDRLPTTLCHKDAFRRNMFASAATGDAGRLTLIDWAYTGRGEIGLDLADLVGASYSTFCVDGDLQELDATAFEAYVAGLADAGWHADPRLARLGFTAAVSLKYASLLLWLGDVAGGRDTTAWERLSGRPIETIVRQHAMLVSYLLDLADEAHELRRTL